MTTAREHQLELLYAQQEHNRLAVAFYEQQILETRREIMALQAPETDEAAQKATLEVLGQVIRIKEAL